MKKTRRHGTRGGGYGFGGSILADAGGANAGSALWNSSTGADCGVSSDRGGNGTFAGGRRRRTRRSRRGGNPLNSSLAGRGGNNMAGGNITQQLGNRGGNGGSRRRRRGGSLATRYGNGGRRSRRRRGGSYIDSTRGGNSNVGNDLAQMSPRTGYTFDGTGQAGTPDPVRA
jgi:hypothetical protein